MLPAAWNFPIGRQGPGQGRTEGEGLGPPLGTYPALDFQGIFR